MALSTAMPMVTAATVMVMKSSGIETSPIAPSTAPAASRFGTMPSTARVGERKSSSSMIATPASTAPRVEIWDVNRLCSMLL